MVARAAGERIQANRLRPVSVCVTEGGEVELCVSNQPSEGLATGRLFVQMLCAGGFAEKCDRHNDGIAPALFTKKQLKKGRNFIKIILCK